MASSQKRASPSVRPGAIVARFQSGGFSRRPRFASARRAAPSAGSKGRGSGRGKGGSRRQGAQNQSSGARATAPVGLGQSASNGHMRVLQGARSTEDSAPAAGVLPGQ